MGCSLLVLLYSVAVLTYVAWMGTIGVRCMFGTKVEEVIPADYEWRNDRSWIAVEVNPGDYDLPNDRPRIGDSLLRSARTTFARRAMAITSEHCAA